MPSLKCQDNAARRITVPVLVSSSDILDLASLSHNPLDIAEVLLNERLQLPADEELVLEHHAPELLKHRGLV